MTSLATTREALAVFAGARRLNGRIQRQQVCLAGDVLNQNHDLADLLCAGCEPLDHGVGAAGFLGGLARDFSGAQHLLADLADRNRQFLVADATVPTLLEACVAAAAAAAVCRAVSSLLMLIEEEMPCISRAATETASTI